MTATAAATLPPCLRDGGPDDGERPEPAGATGRFALAREPELRGVFWDERHVQCIWADKRLRPRLKTTDGLAVHVLEPGRWNGGPGPDFRAAVLEIGGRRVRGDVEVHIRPADWFAHGHDSDHEYDAVALHVCWFPPAPGERVPPVPLAALRDPMLAKPGFSFDQIDPGAYPWRVADAPPRPCSGALAGVGPGEAAAWLEEAGRRRVRRFARALSARADALGDEAQAFWEAAMAGLGFHANSGPMRALARIVPASRLAALPDDEARYATLLAASGMLPDAETGGGGFSPRRAMELWQAAFRAGASFDREGTRGWNLSALRPSNHPRVRLAAAAALFADGGGALRAELEAIPRDNPKSWAREAAAVWIRRAAAGRALLPGRRDGAEAANPLGPGRARALLVNLVVPWISRGDASAWSLLDAIPGEDLGAPGREMAFRLFGPDHNPAPLYAGRSLRIQGLLELWNGICASSGAGCRSCPLAARSRRRLAEMDADA